ncbi:MAG: hypothetical protein ABS46_04085 [Cytophagaceae bacterium SCN 52-12]|nr:MAG: hypothetical protein ABS46_04085 [Cytophagaceae bacterium SCN 52-12]
MNSSNIRQLLFNHFEGRSTPLQIEILKKWLAVPANQELYYNYLQEWERLNPLVVTESPAAYRRFLEKRENSLPVAGPEEEKPRRIGMISYLAAGCLAIVLCSLAYLTHPHWNRRTVVAGAGETLSLRLPDSSRVVLHANASLVAPRFNFLPFDRKVKLLSGEAEFSVVRRSDHRQFTVELADSLRIRVLGTEFTVRQSSRATRVKLDEGRVVLDYPDGSGTGKASLIPGEQIVYWHDTFRVQKIPPNGVIDGKEKEWVLTDVPLEKLAKKIEQEFNVKILIADPKHGTLILNGIVPTGSLDLLLESLAATLDLEISRDGSQIRIM